MRTTEQHPLPYIDTHEVACGAAPDAAFDALWRVVRGGMSGAAAERYARLVRSVPADVRAAAAPVAGITRLAGFAVTAVERPALLELAGRHAFSRYRLTFAVEARAGGGSTLRATTHAEFPGWHGSVYRALVIGTRMHVVVTRGMLGRAAARAASGSASGT